MFHDYLGAPGRYRACFTDDWYLTGDLVRRDGDGHLWFVGRADDVIKSAGHLIGPFDVETVLAADPDVGDDAVVGTHREHAHRRRWATRAEARRDLIRWIEGWFDPRRLHSSNHYRSPIDWDNLYYRRRDGIAA